MKQPTPKSDQLRAMREHNAAEYESWARQQRRLGHRHGHLTPNEVRATVGLPKIKTPAAKPKKR